MTWSLLDQNLLTLPDQQGTMEFMPFAGGILLVVSQIETREDICITFPHDPNGTHISAQYFIQGSAGIVMGNGTKASWEPDRASLIRSDTAGFVLDIAGSQKLKHVCVSMYQAALSPKLENTLIPAALEKVIFGADPVNVAMPIPTTGSMRDSAQELYRRCRNKGTDTMRTESLALRFLSEALDGCIAETGPDADRWTVLSPALRRRHAVHSLKSVIDNEPRQSLPLTDFIATLGMSEQTLRRAFKDEVGVTPNEYRRSAVLLFARERLLTGARSIKEISYDCGYSHVGNFTRAYLKEFGETPSQTQQRTGQDTGSLAPRPGSIADRLGGPN